MSEEDHDKTRWDDEPVGVCIGSNGGWGCRSVEGDDDEAVVENGILLLLFRNRCTRGPRVPM